MPARVFNGKVPEVSSKGKKGPTRKIPRAKGKHKPRKIRDADLQREVLNLRAEGKTYSEIGKALGMDQSTAYKITGAALAEISRYNRETAEQIKAMDDICLQKAKLAIMQRISDGLSDRDLPRFAAALTRVIETRGRLHGYLAPVKVEGEVDVNVNSTATVRIDYSACSSEELDIIERVLERAATPTLTGAGGESPQTIEGIYTSSVAGTKPVNGI